PVREVNPEIPEWLSQIIDRLLAKDCGERYQTAAEVGDVLGRHLARRQEGRGVDTDSRVTEPMAVPADDVGPSKTPPRHLQWLVLLPYLLVILCGLFVLTEVTGRTHILEALRGSSLDGILVLNIRDPELSIRVDGERQWSFLIPNTKVREFRLSPGEHL